MLLWGVVAVAVIVVLLLVIDGLRPAPPWQRSLSSRRASTSSASSSLGSAILGETNEYVPLNFQPQPGKYYIYFGGVVLMAGLSLPVENPVVTSSVAGGRILIGAKLFRGDGVDPVEIANHKFQSPAGSWDLNYDENTTEVVDEKGTPRLQIIAMGPQATALFGLFGDKGQADYLCVPQQLFIKPSPAQVQDPQHVLKRIFKYPSAKFPGQREADANH